jgi:hypothetical protein
MWITRRRERSAPVYVNTDEAVVSLVYEVAVTEAGWGHGAEATTVNAASPAAVHLIDDTGVQQLGFRAERPLLAMCAAFLIGPLQWAILARRRQRRG